MKNIFIMTGLVIAAVFVWFMFVGNTTDYVATMGDDIATLEMELASIEALVSAGVMTPTEAAEAQQKISNRVEAIHGSIESSQKMSLTASQMAQLQTGLERLKQLLTEYRATLTVVDEAVRELPEEERPRRRGGSGPLASIVESISETIEVVEDHVEDVLDIVLETETDEDDTTSDEEVTDAGLVDEATGEEAPMEDDSESLGEADASAELEVEASSELQVDGESIDGSTETEASQS